MSGFRIKVSFHTLLLLLMLIAVPACGNIPSKATPTAISATESPLFGLPSATIEVPSSTSTITPTSSPVSSTAAPALPAVTITAVKGNVYIRRGPDLAYNPISALLQGQSAIASARDVLAKWVQIPLPGQSGKTGWISIQTGFTQVDGNVMNLPEVQPTDWPILAFLRNCTHHQMEVDPGGIIVPPLDNFPDNRVQVNPGVYSVHDIDVVKSPEVMQVELKEGSDIDIRVDGTGLSKKCPVP